MLCWVVCDTVGDKEEERDAVDNAVNDLLPLSEVVAEDVGEMVTEPIGLGEVVPCHDGDLVRELLRS